MASAKRLLLVALLVGARHASPQSSKPPADAPPPLNWTAAQDHQNMMDQLGIKALRPGPSGSTVPGTPNMANYDPDKANPYPDLPDILLLKNGKKVTTADVWWKQ